MRAQEFTKSISYSHHNYLPSLRSKQRLSLVASCLLIKPGEIVNKLCMCALASGHLHACASYLLLRIELDGSVRDDDGDYISP